MASFTFDFSFLNIAQLLLITYVASDSKEIIYFMRRGATSNRRVRECQDLSLKCEPSDFQKRSEELKKTHQQEAMEYEQTFHLV